MNHAIAHEFGAAAVTLFFALSGFLITYLLLQERSKNGEIDIRKFYLRRILRIWPLYFVIILGTPFILYFFIDSNTYALGWQALLLNSFLLANVAISFGFTYPMTQQIWSVSCEEQFYLFWPHFFKRSLDRLANKLILFACSIVLIRILFALSYKLIIVESIFPVSQEVHALMDGLNNLVPMIRFEVMAFGGLAAYALHNRATFPKLFEYLFSKAAFYASIALVLVLIARLIEFKYFMYIKQDVYGAAFCIIILNLAANTKLSSVLEYQPFIFLGDISYGIYMYHVSATYLSMHLSKLIVPVENEIVFSVLFYTLVVSITLVMATLSYNYVEKPFLRLKSKSG
jgi:peptidoglycan/LPS O-acetylase OafA/YrhL